MVSEITRQKPLEIACFVSMSALIKRLTFELANQKAPDNVSSVGHSPERSVLCYIINSSYTVSAIFTIHRVPFKKIPMTLDASSTQQLSDTK